MGAANTKEEGLPDESPTTQGVSFEVILSPKVENARVPQLTPRKEGALTRRAIEEKLEAAEKRRKEKEDAMLQRLAGEDKHIGEVQQAMNEYEERKKRETQDRYQRRLFIFAENQEQVSTERAGQWEEKAKRIEAAKTSVARKEKSFRELMKEKLWHKMEKLRENHTRYTLHRRESARLKAEKHDAVRSAKDQKIHNHSEATAWKMKQKRETLEENREANISVKVARIQEQQARIQTTKDELNRSMEVSSSNTLLELEVRLDRSAVKRQMREEEVQQRAKAHFEKAKEIRRLREEKERRFSDCTAENLQLKFQRAERIREQNATIRQQVMVKNLEREQKARMTAEEYEEENTDKLLEKIVEKQRRLEENRAAVLNAKVERCHKECVKVKMVQETAEELVRNQEKVTNEKLQAKLNSYKENRQRRLSERIKPQSPKIERKSLQEIQVRGGRAGPNQNLSPTKANGLKISPLAAYNDENNENDGEKTKGLAENFRNRNLEFLGLR